MTFKNIFISIIIATAMIISAFLIQSARPGIEVSQPGPEYVRATGKCATCHLKETSAIVHQYSISKHASENVTCYECHRSLDGQKEIEHNGFKLATSVTALNCSQCHTTEYAQILKEVVMELQLGQAVTGSSDFTEEQIALAEKFHPGTVKTRCQISLLLLKGQA